MKHFAFILLLIWLSSACSNKQDSTNFEAEPTQETPEVFQDDLKQVVSSYSKRYSSGLIESLYEEAQEINPNLRQLAKHLNKLHEIKTDSLADFYNYQHNNNQYWRELESYKTSLSDSLLQKELDTFIANLKSQHEKRMAEKVQLSNWIDSIEAKIKDQEILLKLFVTAPLMRNYQTNETPDIQALKHIKSTMDSTLLEVSEYTQ
jgi:hypothetical protein